MLNLASVENILSLLNIPCNMKNDAGWLVIGFCVVVDMEISVVDVDVEVVIGVGFVVNVEVVVGFGVDVVAIVWPLIKSRKGSKGI